MAPGLIGLTGPTGFVGRHVRQRAQLAGFELVSLVRDDQAAVEGDRRSLGDLSDGPLPPSFFHGLDSVIHAAARAHVMDDSSPDPEASFMRANHNAAINVAEAAAAAGVRRMVFISSIKVLGERTVDRPFHPDDPHAPIDPYGRSKAAAERSLSEIAARTGLELVVVRPPLVHGRGAAGNLAMLARLLLKRIPLPIASIDNRRSMVGAGSLAELLLQAASATATGTYHVSDRYPISTPTLVRALGRGLKVRPILLPFPPGLLRMAGKLAGRSAVMERLGGSLEVDAASTVRDFEWQPSDRTEAELAAAAPSMVGHRE